MGYRAIKLGDVSTVALIDKGSVLVAVLLSIILLNETLNLTKVGGAILNLPSPYVVARG